MRSDAGNDSNDLLSERFGMFVIYWLPIAILVASGFFAVGNVWRTAIWAGVFTTMGAGCVVNAFRCGRVHCYATGPFLLLVAVVAVFYGLWIAPFGARGWNTIAIIALVGGIALYYLPELFFGRYRQKSK